jgi:hypothetical protein
VPAIVAETTAQSGYEFLRDDCLDADEIDALARVLRAGLKTLGSTPADRLHPRLKTFASDFQGATVCCRRSATQAEEVFEV